MQSNSVQERKIEMSLSSLEQNAISEQFKFQTDKFFLIIDNDSSYN